MKQKLLKLAIIPMLAMLLMLTPGEASADVGLKGDLGLGGHVLLGGTTGGGGFAFGLTPMVTFNPIDDLAIFGRLPFWEGYFNADVHVFPFIFGARYHFRITDKLRVYPGMGLGFSILHYSVGVFSTNEARFSLDFHGGVEYEIIENLAIDGSFDIFLPNVGSGIFARFGVMVGVLYYLPGIF